MPIERKTVEIIVEKGLNTGKQHFPLFPLRFWFFQKCLCGKRIKTFYFITQF